MYVPSAGARLAAAAASERYVTELEALVEPAWSAVELRSPPMALTLNRSCTASVDIAAPIDVVWDLVSDVTRVGEWSVECRSCEWLGGATGPTAGAQFRGRNRRNATPWTRTCEVLAVDPPKRFVWRTLPTRLLPDSTEWTVELADGSDHTRLTESMRILHIPGPYERLFALMLPQHRDRTADLEGDLRRIKERLESATTEH